MIARNSAEVEFRVLAHGICESIWIRRLLEELRFSQIIPIPIYSDNKVTISFVHNPVLRDETKHIEVDKHFIKEKIVKEYHASLIFYQNNKSRMC